MGKGALLPAREYYRQKGGDPSRDIVSSKSVAIEVAEKVGADVEAAHGHGNARGEVHPRPLHRGTTLSTLKKAQDLANSQKNTFNELQEDNLIEPLNADSYVAFRLRPIARFVEQELPWLSRCLSTWDMVIILTNTAGTVLVVFHRGAWVALTVALAAIGNSVIDTWAFRP